ncbi:MAG: alpha/beta fold hydrolase [Candidatus Kapabacteria bacterium]|nr:alpha/beta fold hydrolase [Candidatus Kapabacteria bacterium]
MRRILTILTMIFIAGIMYGQDITGQWNGIIKVQGMQLSLVFHITKSDSGLTSTMDSPDQKAFGIPVTSTTFENSKLKMVIATANIEYNGEFKSDNIAGTFKQSGQEFPLNLTKGIIEKEVIIRPQEPKKPYPYYSEDVKFRNNKDSITLAGTLTLPQKEGNFPAVILITGSGPQNRDEELMGHKPFLVLSDYLTRNGIAVLRFDDRGFGESEGNFQTATTFDFAADVESAVEYLKTRKEINKSKIGLAGHSEGGIIAPIVAAQMTDDIDFIVLLAGTGIRGDELLLLQQKLIYSASGVSEVDLRKILESNKKAFKLIQQSKDDKILEKELTEFIRETIKSDSTSIPEGMTEDDLVALQVSRITNPWMLNFIRYDPATALEKVKCPVLAVNGAKDLQVPPNENLSAIKNALDKGGNHNVTIMLFPNLNHLFQECNTGLPDEYGGIEQTFSPIALEDITNWIVKQTK